MLSCLEDICGKKYKIADEDDDDDENDDDDDDDNDNTSEREDARSKESKKEDTKRRSTHNMESSSGFKLKNSHITPDMEDILYHLALGNKSHDLVAMFGDVKVFKLCTRPN